MRQRPLSPHLSIYRLAYTMALSISHRITGIVMAVGLLLLTYWLLALATGPAAYAGAMRLMGSWFVQLLLAGWLLAFVYHLCNGIRHLTFDMGLGMEKAEARRSAIWTVAVTVLIFGLLAFLAFFARSVL